MRFVLAIVIVTGVSFLGYSQHGQLWVDMKNRFPEEPAVYLERSEVLNIFVDGDSLKLFSDIFEDIMYLKDQAKSFSGKKVYGSHFSEITDLKAKTLVWEGNKYRSVAVTGFNKNHDPTQGAFFDDSYYYSFDYPLIASGNRSILQYRELEKDARFISGFVFASHLPQAKVSYTIKTTKEVDLYVKILNDPDNKIQFKKTEKGKNITYQWVLENQSPIKREEDSPSVRYYVPHLVCYVKSYQVKDKKKDVISGLPSLYEWYQTFIKDVNKNTTSELRLVVDSLKKESRTEIELVSKVFYWVQDNIKYIAFEQGMRGLIPNSGSYTCEKRYGDCKDMANLIVNMLQTAGVNAYHTWIGSRDLPYKYSELPTPIVDNHMIATYISPEGKYYFLDATGNYTPMGFPSSMIQGKEALIALSPTQYEIKEVPVIEAKASLMIDSVVIQLQKNEITGSGKCSLTGFTKIFAGYDLHPSDKDQLSRNLTSIIGKGSNKFLLDNFSISNSMNYEKPTQITYDFKLIDYFQKTDDDIYLNLNLDKEYNDRYIDIETRKNPKKIEYKYEKRHYVELTIPEGYKLEFLPDNASHSGKWLGYEITYRAEGNKVFFSKRLYLNSLLLEPSQFYSWNDEVKSLSKVYKESILLKKK